MLNECCHFFKKNLDKCKYFLVKKTNWIPPDNRYGCIIVKPDKVIQLYHTEIKYHHKMRYIYYPINREIEDYLLSDSNEILIRFGFPDKSDITRFEFNINDVKNNETVFNNEKYQEWYIFNDHHKFIIKINKNTGVGYIILIISREYLLN